MFMHLIKKNRAAVYISILILFHLFFNTLWIIINKSPLSWDPANHAYTASTIKECILQFEGIAKCYSASQFYPIFSQSILAIIFVIFGTSSFISQIYATIIFTLSILIVYFWAKSEVKNTNTALITATFYSFTPSIFGYSKFFWLEFPTVLLVFLTLFLLNKSNYLTNKKIAYLVFVFLGFGVATRTYFVVYMLVPLLYSLVKLVLNKKLLPNLKNLFAGTLITASIALPWYLVNWSNFLYYSNSYILADASEPQILFSLNNLLWYLNRLINEILMFNISIIFLLSLLFVAFTALSKQKKAYLLTNFVIVYLVFTFIANKDVRYLFALVPYTSLIIAVSFNLIVNKIPSFIERYLFVISTFVILLFSYFVLSFNFPINDSIKKSVKVPHLGYIDTYNTTNFPIEGVNYNKWPIKNILNTVSAKSAGNKVLFAAYVEYPHLNNRNIVFGTKEYNYNNILIYDDFEFNSNGHTWTENDLNTFLLKKDYILIPTNQTSPDYYIFKKSLDAVQIYVFSNPNKFAEVQKFKIPYQELADYLQGSNLPNVTSKAEEKCKVEICDEVILFKVKK